MRSRAENLQQCTETWVLAFGQYVLRFRILVVIMSELERKRRGVRDKSNKIHMGPYFFESSDDLVGTMGNHVPDETN